MYNIIRKQENKQKSNNAAADQSLFSNKIIINKLNAICLKKFSNSSLQEITFIQYSYLFASLIILQYMEYTTTDTFSAEKAIPSPKSGLVDKFLDLPLLIFSWLLKIALTPFIFFLSITSFLLSFVGKVLKLGLTFFLTGIQGVQRTLKIGAFAEKIHYAILKENGQYLKLVNKTLEQIFTCQLYDYGIRKFMSISQIQEDTKVTEIQLWSTVGLNFLKEKFNLNYLSALSNSNEKINRFKAKIKESQIYLTDYSTETITQPQDIFIFFNRSRLIEQHQQHIDMIKVLGYIKKNLTENGYAVIGNYFDCEGDSAVFEQIIEGFGFKIQMKEDITPNISHSRRVLARIHKNRKIAWGILKIKQYIKLLFEHNNIASNSIRSIWKFLNQLSGIRAKVCKYNLYILEHAI